MKIYFLISLVFMLGTQAIDAFPNRNEIVGDCSQCDDGETLPDANSCSKYYLCIGGEAIPQCCAFGLYYDALTGQCNRAFLVDCPLDRWHHKVHDIEDSISDIIHYYDNEAKQDHYSPPKTPYTTTTTCTTTTCAPPKPQRIHALRKTPCTTTTTCTPTKPPCTTPTTCTTTKRPCTTPTTRCRLSSKDCNSLEDGTILLDCKHCRRYYVCTNKKTKLIVCKAGYWYDRDALSCRPRDAVKNCPCNRN